MQNVAVKPVMFQYFKGNSIQNMYFYNCLRITHTAFIVNNTILHTSVTEGAGGGHAPPPPTWLPGMVCRYIC